MLKRTKYFIGGLLISLTVGAIAQTGGLPSRPRFLSVGVGTAAPSTNGNVNVSGSVTAGNVDVSGSVTAGNVNVSGSVTASNFVGNVGGVAPSDFARLSQSNTFNGNINATGTVTAANASISGTITAGNISAGTGTITAGNISAGTGDIAIAKGSAGRGYITASNGGPSNSGYFNFIDETDNRAGYIGFADTTEFRITAEGLRAIALAAPGGVKVNGSQVCRADGVNCPAQAEQACGFKISPSGPSVVSNTCDVSISASSCGTGCITVTHNLDIPNYNVVCSAAGNFGNGNAQPYFCTPSLFNNNTVQINTWAADGSQSTPSYNIHVVIVR